MNTTLGKHLLIDFYNCRCEFHEPEELRPFVEQALAVVGTALNDITFFRLDEELECMAVSDQSHICIHVYPELAYTAVDIYSFNSDIKANQIMSSLKSSLHSDRIKATSVRRGDFGSIRDMRPKRNSKITAVRRVKNTGARIKKTSATMLNILRHPKRTHQFRNFRKKN